MPVPMPVVWLAALIVFALIEGAVASNLVSIWFAAGSLAALIVSLFSDFLPAQIAVFLVVSVICLALVRPVASRWLNPRSQPTNADRLIGQTALVTEAIDNLAAQGQVTVSGQVWSARSDGEEQIPAGARVTVLRIEGVKLIVRPADGPQD